MLLLATEPARGLQWWHYLCPQACKQTMLMDSRGLFLNTTQTSQNHNCLVSRHIKNTFWQNGSYSKSLVANVHHLFVLRNGFPNLCRWFCMCHFFQISDRSLCKQIRPWTDKAEWQCSEKNACVASPKPWHALCENPSLVWTNMSFNCLSTAIFQYLRGVSPVLWRSVSRTGAPNSCSFFSEQL